MGAEYSPEIATRQKLIGDPNNSILIDYLDNGSGVIDMARVADTYRIKPTGNDIYLIDKCRIVIADDVTIDIGVGGEKFGGIAALATGCKFEIRDDKEKVLVDLTGGETIQTNSHLSLLGKTNFFNMSTGSRVSTEFKPSAPIRLDARRGESLVFQSQDSLANLESMRIKTIGRIFTNTMP
jgi:hypothetical protein